MRARAERATVRVDVRAACWLVLCWFVSEVSARWSRGAGAGRRDKGRYKETHYLLVHKILAGCGGSVSLLVRPMFTLLYFTLPLSLWRLWQSRRDHNSRRRSRPRASSSRTPPTRT